MGGEVAEACYSAKSMHAWTPPVTHTVIKGLIHAGGENVWLHACCTRPCVPLRISLFSKGFAKMCSCSQLTPLVRFNPESNNINVILIDRPRIDELILVQT